MSLNRIIRSCPNDSIQNMMSRIGPVPAGTAAAVGLVRTLAVGRLVMLLCS